MKNLRSRKSFVIYLAAITLAVTVFTIPAQASPDVASEKSPSASESFSTLAAPQDLTREEMLNAIPLDAPKGPVAKPSDVSSFTTDATEEPVVGSHPVEPEQQEDFQIQSAFNPQIGKVFMRKAGTDTVISCSGSVINSEGKNMVLTAGHCNYNHTSGWYIGANWNWTFVPGYDHGRSPYGQWHAHTLVTTNDWYNSRDFNDDVGLALVNPRYGVSLVSAMGALGVTWGRPAIGQFTVQGYPAEGKYDGQWQHYCTGTSRHHSTNQIELSCDMTRGVSGSPWLIGYNTSSGYANGVASNIDRVVNPTVLRSPYFSSSNIGTIYNEYRYG